MRQCRVWNFNHFLLPLHNFDTYFAVEKNIFKRLNKITRKYPQIKFHEETINKLTHKPPCVLILWQWIFTTIPAQLHFFGIHKTFCLYSTCCTESCSRSVETICWLDWCCLLLTSTLKKALYCAYSIELLQSGNWDVFIVQLSSVYTEWFCWLDWKF